MRQPKQQLTYADLYSQQRPAPTSPAPQEGTRPAQQSSNGRSGAAVAAGSVCCSRPAASEHRTSPGAAAAAMKSSSSPPKASPDGLTAHKPSRIPVHPGKSPSSSPAVISSAGGVAAAAQHARDASPPAAISGAAAAHGHGNGPVAASNGTCTVTSTAQQVRGIHRCSGCIQLLQGHDARELCQACWRGCSSLLNSVYHLCHLLLLVVPAVPSAGSTMQHASICPMTAPCHLLCAFAAGCTD